MWEGDSPSIQAAAFHPIDKMAMAGGDEAKRFASEFRSKLDSADNCCIPATDEAANIPRCMGSHVLGAANRVNGALFACYWGAVTQQLSGEALRGAAAVLGSVTSVPNTGFVLADQDSTCDSCVLENKGLELFAGALCGKTVMCDGTHMHLDNVLDSSYGWNSVDAETLVFWEDTDNRRPTIGYLRKEVTVGYFASFRNDTIKKDALSCYVCRHGKSRGNAWIEYADRTSRIYRFEIERSVFLVKKLVETIVRDALYRGYKHDLAIVRHKFDRTCETRSSAYAYRKASDAASNMKKNDLVVVVMPALSDCDSISDTNKALAVSSAELLALFSREELQMNSAVEAPAGDDNPAKRRVDNSKEFQDLNKKTKTNIGILNKLFEPLPM